MKAYRFDGEQITRPGAYVGVDIETYHGDLVAGRFVTASSLKRADRSMAHFWAHCAWNPNREPPEEDTDALRLGKAQHILAFQPELFDRQFAVCPYGDDYRLKDAKQWRENLLANDPRLPLKPKEFVNIQRMAEALYKDPDARSLFARGLPEMTFCAQDEATGIWMLTRPDFTPGNRGRGLVDYKTSENGSWDVFGRRAFDYGYHLQVALALDVVAAATGEMRPCFWMCVQEKEAPFAVSVHRWEPDQIMYGRRRVRDLIDQIAKCSETGEWPGYGPAQSLVTPFFIQREIEYQDAAV